VIKAVFFDAADVFYERAASTRGLATSLVKQMGLSGRVPEADLAREKNLQVQATDGRISYQTYWEEFLRMRGVADPGKQKTIVTQVIGLVNQVVTIPGGREATSG
jgi:hypothetical protein